MKPSDRKLVVLLGVTSFIIFLITLNKYWTPFDEGIVTVGAERILQGEIPYKDFFIVMYPPGQIYVLSFLYKVFGVSLEIGRFYTVLIHVLIVMCVFLIARDLTKKISISLALWFISLTCLGLRLGVSPFPIWPGVGFSLLSLYLFIRYVENNKFQYLLYSGLTVGIATLFRHDMGIYAFLSILVGLLVYKRIRRETFYFTGFSLVLPLSVFLYLFSKSATVDIFNSLILFPFIHEKTAVLTFPKPCFNLNMIFHQSLYFINVNQYYIPLLIYGFIALFLLITLIKKLRLDKDGVMLLTLLIFGLLSFNQARIRTDPAHLLTSIHPSILLFGFILSKAISERGMPSSTRRIFMFYTAILLFLFSLLVVKNLDKSIKNIIKKPYRGSVLLTKFNRGSLYIPREESSEISNVVSFVKENTRPDESIYIGNIAHWKDDFGGSLILYTLCERMPSTKYYEILPGLITQEKVQEEIKESLSRKSVNLIVLQDIDLGPNRKSSILDDYIENNFKVVKKIGKYNIYEKR